jgi:hypothetical protein
MIRRKLLANSGAAALRRTALIAFGAALLAVGMTATAAGAATAAGKPQPTGSVIPSTAVPAGFASWTDLLQLQARMNATAERIIAAAHQTADSGFAGVIADPTNRELRVYWKGQAPAGLVAATRATVPVSVLPAAYTERELAAASARMLAKAGTRITSVGPRADGAGLLVGTQNGLAAAASYAGVPVTVQTGVAASPATRWNDSPAWWGGGAWVNATLGGGCSTGFAVFHAGLARMLSAAHCANLGNLATDPTGQTIGTVVADTTGSDTLVINGSSAGRVFNNSTNAAGGVVTEFTNPVAGSQRSFVGNFVCTSGAYSGTRCSIQVVARDLCITVRGVGTVCGQVQAENTTRTNAIGQGDSGGPVEIVNAANPSQVFATGTNTAIDDINTAVACTGYVPTGRTCAWRMYFEDIFSGMAGVGATSVVLG